MIDRMRLLLDKKNHSWIAAVCVLLVFSKWVVFPAWLEKTIQEKKRAELSRKLESLNIKSTVYSAEQIHYLLTEWETDFPFPLSVSRVNQTWICRAKSSEIVPFLITLETALTEKPLPLQWVEIDLENEEISFGVSDGF